MRKPAALYRLSYSPAWIGEDKARLVFRSPGTGESFDYTLTGVGEEPLAEASISIVCKARESAQVGQRAKRGERDLEATLVAGKRREATLVVGKGRCRPVSVMWRDPALILGLCAYDPISTGGHPGPQLLPERDDL